MRQLLVNELFAGIGAQEEEEYREVVMYAPL